MVLITGGAGFIGSNIAEEIPGAKILDNLSTANKESISFVRDSGFHLISGSVNNYDLLLEVLKDVDIVYHQAAVPSVPRSIEDPITTNEANIGGTLTLLKACVDSGVSKIIYASSSSVYGDTPTLPKVETMPPAPKSPYAVSKLIGEHYMRVFSELYGITTISLRYFNVFGPRQNLESQYAAVIPKFVRAALLDKPITIYGDGNQTRDFTYVKDVVSANMKASRSPDSGVYNIAGGTQTTINDLATMIIDLTGSNSEVTYLPERRGDVKHSLADISRAKEIGWKPKYDLKKGLKEYIAYIKR